MSLLLAAFLVGPVQAPTIGVEYLASTNSPPADVSAHRDVHTRADVVLGRFTVNWDAVAQCESSGDWSISDGYHEGGLQFAPSTWDAYKPPGYPDAAYQASRAQQILVAELVLEEQGRGAWPNC